MTSATVPPQTWRHGWRIIAAGTLCAAATAVPAATSWPTVTVPAAVSTFDMGGDLTINGLPLRMRGLLSVQPPHAVAAMFRASLGPPVVETVRGASLVLGRALDGYYVTVQLNPAGRGTRGVLAVTRPAAALDQQVQAAQQRTLARFPAGTRLLSHMRSVDGQRHAEYLVLSNALGIGPNREHLQRLLAAQGYQAENPAIVATPAATPAAGTTLHFKRRDAQATAAIYRTSDGATAIVLNTVTGQEATP